MSWIWPKLRSTRVLPGERTPDTAGGRHQRELAPGAADQSRLAGGYCLGTTAQSHGTYANICEHSPNFRSETNFLPVLQPQYADAETLATADTACGWGAAAACHRRLIDRLDLLIIQTHAS